MNSESSILRDVTDASILVVDDNPANVELLNEILKTQYRVLFALNGDDAVRTAKEHQPDLILLDIIMPGGDGYEICRRLQESSETRDIPIIFVTAMDRIEDEEKGLALGAVDYIAKPFSPAIVRLRVANHIELKRQRDILYSLAQLDGLTGIANRRAFDGSFERFWHAQARKGLALSVVMLDIDHFKLFNDNYGHTAGDDCLRQVAGTLVKTVQRGQDTIARFGGEEFAALLPDADAAGARSIAQRMLESVSALQIEHLASPAPEKVLTVSLGVSSCVPDATRAPMSLLQSADEALYASKDAGGARVTVKPLPSL
ncbi:MAG: diguanylate cyclase [Pseudomonadota bacterium]